MKKKENKRIETFEILKKRNADNPKIKEYCDKAIKKLKKGNQRDA